MVTSTLIRKASKAVALVPGIFTPRRRGDVVVLLYHRVGAGDREIDLPADSFGRQLEALVERDRVLSLDRALEDDEGGVVVTFDDGTSDFHEHVVPHILRLRVPVLLYLATGMVEGGALAPNGEALTWSQLAEAQSTGLVAIGSHTHTHADLARADERLAEDEMLRSKEMIEDRLGTPCRHFAYPWSVASPEADRAARRLFETAALPWGTNRRGRVDLHRLARLPVLRSDGPMFFRAKAMGLLDREALVYRLAGRGPWRRA